MNLSDDIALVVDQNDRDGDRSTISILGRPTDVRIGGSVLEAAIQCAPGYLLFVTADTLHDELLHVHLVSTTGSHLDSAAIGGLYVSGAFKSLELEPPDRVRFRFFEDARWSIRVLRHPRAVLPWWRDARGVWRGARLTRHFEVSRSPR